MNTKNIIGKRFIKKDYEKFSKKSQDEFPFYCPDDKPYMCTLDGPSYGLCKRKLNECKKYSGENELPIYDLSNIERQQRLDFGKNYNYNLYGNINKDCSKITLNSQMEYDKNKEYIKLPNKFKIMTYNLWWSLKKPSGNSDMDEFNETFFALRMKKICKIINDNNADIVCLQEVGQQTFDIILPLLNKKYKYCYENPLCVDLEKKGRDLDTFCFSKYPVNNFKLYSVHGNLNYNNSMLVLEFDNIVIFNVYLQAGTKNSPGQKDLWFNYSRCRYNEYMAIGQYMKDSKIKKPIIVLGDFNTNLNGTFENYPS